MIFHRPLLLNSIGDLKRTRKSTYGNSSKSGEDDLFLMGEVIYGEIYQTSTQINPLKVP